MAKRPASTLPKFKRQRHRQRGLLGRILIFLVKLVLALILLSVLWVVAYRFINPPMTLTMLGDVAAGRGAERHWMGLDRMDRDMVRAAIGAEDSKFCAHSGFDFDAIQDALKRNASGGRIRGGSTISQQTAKNAFLWQGGGYARKGAEAWFTFLIEQMWGKRRIMEVYLNLAETGIGTYGANAGSLRYFGHDASAMSATEAARIAAVLPLPKQRGAIAPKGFTRRYGNSIAARIGVVGRDGLDVCVYADAAAPVSKAPPVSKKTRPIPGAEYETATPPPAPVMPDDVVLDEPAVEQPAVEPPPADAPVDDLPASEEPVLDEPPPSEPPVVENAG